MAKAHFKTLERFLHVEAASGVVLLLFAAAALIWANSPASSSYAALWRLPITTAGGLLHDGSLQFWINEGLMTIFFLVVGLEVRRELHDGALSTRRTALLPLIAACGGIAVPALIYLALGNDEQIRQGWAVPTATDIAFAVGVLALLGRRIPSTVRVLLLALAIIDDIAAILAIAFFYSDGVALSGMLITAAGVVAALLLQRLGAKSALIFVLPGAIVWFGLLKSGVHPTLAGVILGLLTPASATARIQNTLHPWVAYAIMPLFALANAGVNFASTATQGSDTATLLTWSVIAGLVLGKPVGIVLASAAAVRFGLCALPPGVTWGGVLLVGCLGGIGFTMSIFIAMLAFPDEALLNAAKFGVLIASSLAAIVGLLVGLYVGWPLKPVPAAPCDPHPRSDTPFRADARAEEKR